MRIRTSLVALNQKSNRRKKIRKYKKDKILSSPIKQQVSKTPELLSVYFSVSSHKAINHHYSQFQTCKINIRKRKHMKQNSNRHAQIKVCDCAVETKNEKLNKK